MAVHSRRVGDTKRAIKQLERGLVLCEGHECRHPAIAVEAARVRLNLSAALSCSGRHRAAKDLLSEAQKSLAEIIDWADDLAARNDEVHALTLGIRNSVEEARQLHCAAVLAEAIESESGPWPGSE